MSWLHPLQHIKPLSMAIALITLTGCGSQKVEREFISVKPEVPSLNKNVLHGMQPNSTELLKKAEHWYVNSGKLLDSVTEPSSPSAK